MMHFCPAGFQSGLDRLLLEDAAVLEDRRVALLSHQAALDASGRTSAQALRDALGVLPTVILGPEHGFFGLASAGEKTSNELYPEWGVPVFSLFGEVRKPTPAMLENMDILVVDLQDIGVRCYTYAATLLWTLEACAQQGVEALVLDRPVPLPDAVDGPVTQGGCESFVAPAGLPMCPGLTPGELAVWYQRFYAPDLRLRVSWMKGWDPGGSVSCFPGEWIPPSPALRHWESARVYPATVFTEALPSIDCARAQALSFRLLCAPWIPPGKLYEALEARNIPGVSFHPWRYRAGGSIYGGEVLDGLRMRVDDAFGFRPVRTTAEILWAITALSPDLDIWTTSGARPAFFDALYGGPGFREALCAGRTPVEIESGWKDGVDAFRAQRASILHYSRKMNGAKKTFSKG